MWKQWKLKKFCKNKKKIKNSKKIKSGKRKQFRCRREEKKTSSTCLGLKSDPIKAVC